MSDTPCPDDQRLWLEVMGDTLDWDLQKHLDQCVLCQARIDTLQGDVQAIRDANRGSGAENDTNRLSESLPLSIGGYPILARLGSGGQADVYRAWHPRLKTDVVIKWYRHDAFPEAQASQFTSEAHTLITIRHPNLGQIFDVGVEEGRHFVIMEYISGHTFSSWQRKFKPTTLRIAAVLARAADAVDAVHRQGALHLDLKPGNVIVDDEGNPRVIDFGMARLHGQGSQQSLLLAPGTPEYMSPEQCAGDASRISVASDVYGLGAILFSALCGRPIRTEGRMALEPDWSLIRHAPRQLRWICRKALAIRPQDRQASAAALARDLEQFAGSRSIRNRSLAVTVVVAGIISSLWGGLTFPSCSPLARLVIETQRRQQNSGQVVYERRCEAILAERRLPGLLVVTATTLPIQVTRLVHEVDADWLISKLDGEDRNLQIADNAGPHLILACATRDWGNPNASELCRVLKSLQVLSVTYPIEILVNQDQVILIPANSHDITSAESEQHRYAMSAVQKIQAHLSQLLPCYSGIVVIPRSLELVASIPESGITAQMFGR